MSPFRRLRGLPLTVKAPLLVAALMIGLGAVASERVLARMAALQERQLRDLASLYLDGLSVAVLPAALREDVWEAFDALDRATRQDRSLKARVTTLADEHGTVLASSDPLRFPSGARAPHELAAAPLAAEVSLTGSASTAPVRAALLYEGRLVGQLYAEFDVTALRADRRAAAAYLLAGNAVATALLSLIGFVLVRRMLRPLATLAEHMGDEGGPAEITAAAMPDGGNEFGGLFRQYNALVRAERTRQADAQRMAEHERLVSLGRLAASVAHEVNNPLGGLLNAVDTLRRHGDRPGVAASSIALIERGLLGIRDVVRAMLETHRPAGVATVLEADDFDDLRLLIVPELRRLGQRLDWRIDPGAFAETTAQSGPVRQAVLNLLLNASAAAGPSGAVGLSVVAQDAGFAVTVTNDGAPLPEEARRLIETGEAAAGGGVGLRVVVDAARRLGATLSVDTATGTAITLAVPGAAAHERAA